MLSAEKFCQSGKRYYLGPRVMDLDHRFAQICTFIFLCSYMWIIKKKTFYA